MHDERKGGGCDWQIGEERIREEQGKKQPCKSDPTLKKENDVWGGEEGGGCTQINFL